MKHRNPAAKALAKPEHRQRVIPDKRDAARRAAKREREYKRDLERIRDALTRTRREWLRDHTREFVLSPTRMQRTPSGGNSRPRGGFDGVDYSERKIGANALLMASAPELLAALKGAIPYLKPNTPAMVRRSINTAIAKAVRGPSIVPDDFQPDHNL